MRCRRYYRETCRPGEKVPRNEPRALKHPPIREAVIEVRVELDDPKGRLELLKSLADKLTSQYPKVSPLEHFEGAFTLEKATGKASAETKKFEQRGFRLSAEDKGAVVQLIRDRLVFSLVLNEPGTYQGWNSLCGPALQLWTDFHQAIGKPKVTRVGLRFIDLIETPPIEAAIGQSSGTDGLPMVNMFHRLPAIEWGEQRVTVARSEVHSPDGRKRLILQQAWTKKPESDAFLLTLDIDAIAFGPFDGAVDELRGTLEELRVIKNQAFFDTFAPEVLKGFDQ